MSGPQPRTDRWFARDRIVVAGALLLAVAVFGVSWYRHATVRSTTFDLGVFDQALWKLSHGQTPTVTTIGWNIFADHGSPVLLLFVPLFRLAASPLWLFAAQAAAAAFGLLALAPLLDASGLTNRWLRRAFTIAYIASPLLWNATIYDFHPTTLAVPFLMVAITAALRHRVGVLVAMSACVLLLRDDLGPAVAAAALIGVTAVHGRERQQRFTLAGAGLAWTAVGSVLGKLMGADRNWHFHYGYIAGSAASAVAEPWRTIPRVVRGLERFDNHLLLLAWLVPLALLPLLRPIRFGMVLLLGAPLLLSAGVQFHSPHFHYGAPLLPFLILAAATGAPRLPRWLPLSAVAVAIVVGTGFAFVRWGPPDTHALTRGVANRTDLRRAMRLIKPTDGVAAGTNMGSQLAMRDLLLPFPAPFSSGRRDFPLKASVRRVSAERAARINIVIVDVHEIRRTRRAYAHFLMSPYLTGFRRYDFGDILLWRREP